MTAARVRTVRVTLLPDGAMCSLDDGRVFHAETPSSLWRWLAGAAPGAPVQLLAEGEETAPGAVHAAAFIGTGAADAVFGPIGPNGARPPMTIEGVRVQRVSAGSMLIATRRGDQIAAMLAGLPWRATWANDLAEAVSYLCPPAPGDQHLAQLLPGSAFDAPSGLLPLRQAAPGAFDPTAPTILVYGACDASAMLYFDGFAALAGVNLRFLRPSWIGADLAWLCAASAVIVVRQIEGALRQGLDRMLGALDIPLYWFVDDDFFRLAEEYPSFESYTAERHRDLHAKIAGIIAATPALRLALVERLNFPGDRVRVLAPSLSPRWPRQNRPVAGVGLIGGSFRGAALRDRILPGLLQRPDPPRLIASDAFRPFLDGVSAVYEPFEPDFLTFLHRWQALAPAVLLHPPGRTGNLHGKSDATILVAQALGAVPVVADEPAFADWGEEQGVFKLPLGAASSDWAAAVQRATHALEQPVLADRLTRALRDRGRDKARLDDLLAATGWPRPVGDLLFEERLNRALGALPVALVPYEDKVRPRLAQRLKRSLAKRLARWRAR